MKYRNYEVAYRKLYKKTLPEVKEIVELETRAQAKAITKRIARYLDTEYDLEVGLEAGLDIYHIVLNELMEKTEIIAEDATKVLAHEDALEAARHPYRFEDEDVLPRPIFRKHFDGDETDEVA
jgi:hypothetical protein